MPECSSASLRVRVGLGGLGPPEAGVRKSPRSGALAERSGAHAAEPSGAGERRVGGEMQFWRSVSEPRRTKNGKRNLTLRESGTPGAKNAAPLGHFELVIKVYPNGAMTQHMDKMKEKCLSRGGHET